MLRMGPAAVSLRDGRPQLPAHLRPAVRPQRSGLSGAEKDVGLAASELCGSPEKKAAAMPDSPADVKTQSRSTPPNMPPPSPAATQGATRHPTFTPNPSE
ncbi:hypothetical protein lerEdw1_002803 [Lerista edwardsae]|nr:hypothetical protein lerEdw1_002803 [Lerista edwardsae]